MGRLTRRKEDGTAYILLYSDPSRTTDVLRERAEKGFKMIQKLAHYEDLEEQGRLIEQKHGHWIKSRKYYDDGYTVIGACSVCGIEFQAKLLRKIYYCPHCGAKMSSEPSDEEKRAMTEEAFDILAKMDEVEE